MNLAGPTLTNAQIVANGDLNFSAGAIRDTKVNGPAVFVYCGHMTMNGSAEFTGNSVAGASGTLAPDSLRANEFSPITVYNGTFDLTGGVLQGNSGYRLGGAVDVWGNKDALAKVNLSGGVITENTVSHPRYNGLGGGLFTDHADVVLDGTKISKNATEYGGGMTVFNGAFAMKSGAVESNNNGDFDGYVGGVCSKVGPLTISCGTISENYSLVRRIRQRPAR